jgi:hypothetical protein
LNPTQAKGDVDTRQALAENRAATTHASAALAELSGLNEQGGAQETKRKEQRKKVFGTKLKSLVKKELLRKKLEQEQGRAATDESGEPATKKVKTQEEPNRHQSSKSPSAKDSETQQALKATSVIRMDSDACRAETNGIGWKAMPSRTDDVGRKKELAKNREGNSSDAEIVGSKGSEPPYANVSETTVQAPRKMTRMGGPKVYGVESNPIDMTMDDSDDEEVEIACIPARAPKLSKNAPTGLSGTKIQAAVAMMPIRNAKQATETTSCELSDDESVVVLMDNQNSFSTDRAPDRNEVARDKPTADCASSPICLSGPVATLRVRSASSLTRHSELASAEARAQASSPQHPYQSNATRTVKTVPWGDRKSAAKRKVGSASSQMRISEPLGKARVRNASPPTRPSKLAPSRPRAQASSPQRPPQSNATRTVETIPRGDRKQAAQQKTGSTSFPIRVYEPAATRRVGSASSSTRPSVLAAAEARAQASSQQRPVQSNATRTANRNSTVENSVICLDDSDDDQQGELDADTAAELARTANRNSTVENNVICLDDSDDDQQGELDADIAAGLARLPQPEKVGTYTHEEFCKLWESAEKDMGFSTEAIEKGSLVRGANKKIRKEDTTEQQRAQYGRFSFKAMKVRCATCTIDC